MICFVSDVHLGSGDKSAARKTEALFTAWLDSVARTADEVWLLGDIFDFWFEYRRVVPKGFVRPLAKLAELHEQGVKIRFFTGNHDMWTGDFFADTFGAEVCKEPLMTEAAGRRIFAAHGDNMCIEGQHGLKFMNAVFRSRTLRFLFSWLVHPDLAMKFGRWWSGRSRKSHGGEVPASLLDPLTDYADRLGRERGVDICIFGHFHKADIRKVADGAASAVFLGDWSGDAAVYAVLDDDGAITLKTFDNR